MKTFVVNLAKNTERMASMEAQLGALGMEYERIEAVYGKALCETFAQRLVRELEENCGDLLS